LEKTLQKPTCETSIVDENMKLADESGISSLPLLILLDGRILPVYQDAKTVHSLQGRGQGGCGNRRYNCLWVYLDIIQREDVN